MIKIQGLKFSYPEQDEAVLKDITLDIGRGETILLCGVSGCGKSTLLRTINGMIPHVADDEISGSPKSFPQNAFIIYPRKAAVA
ncbi:MAG: ATP-binding cassette domain-containing protein [Ruminococcus sp.]|uniref:ATP-binding cassette domain-containing protein n=1 Tax=Ruminococcus sp. TaxID=41978 RepID=UPI0025F066AC|nr:ATP-binding cassette domain-containing protein [Ruminococcus sp.]MBR0530668.1 ATP-binding cassette domain-containing protein [Ruminococcus sp.]